MLLASYMALGDRPRDTRNRGTARTRTSMPPESRLRRKVFVSAQGSSSRVSWMMRWPPPSRFCAKPPGHSERSRSEIRATVGGNIASGLPDRTLLTCLLALNATVQAASRRRRPPLHAAARFSCRTRSDRHRARGLSRRRDRAARRGLSGLCHGRSAQRAILPPSRMAFHHPSGDTCDVAGLSGRGLPCRS